MATFTGPEGQQLELDDQTVIDLKALIHVARKPEPEVIKEAVERHWVALVPSAKPAPKARRKRGETS